MLTAPFGRTGHQSSRVIFGADCGFNIATGPKQIGVTEESTLREHQPPTLVAWGKNDPIFPAAGAEPYKRDLKNLEFHLLDTGHFALEEDGDKIADLMRNFLRRNVKR